MKYLCSNCNSNVSKLDNYCPFCGSYLEPFNEVYIKINKNNASKITKGFINKVLSLDYKNIKLSYLRGVLVVKSNMDKLLFKLAPYGDYFLVFCWEVSTDFPFIGVEYHNIRKCCIDLNTLFTSDGNIVLKRKELHRFLDKLDFYLSEL